MDIVNFNEFAPSEGVFYVTVHPDPFFEAEEKIVVNLVRPNMLSGPTAFVPKNTNAPPGYVLGKPVDSRIIFDLEQTVITIRGGNEVS